MGVVAVEAAVFKTCETLYVGVPDGDWGAMLANVPAQMSTVPWLPLAGPGKMTTHTFAMSCYLSECHPAAI